MIIGRICALAMGLISATASAQHTPTQTALPVVVNPLPAPPDRHPRARVLLADYRYDDLLWENDKTAHRIYGLALEKAEPPSGSGIDSWGKNVAWPFADRQLRGGDQHSYHGEGMDFYHVGTTRGAGGLGIWYDNKLWTSRNYSKYRILQTGAVADFEVDYAPWPVDVVRKVWETRRFTLPLGTHFTRMVSTIRSDLSDPLIVGIGIGKRPTSGRAGSVTIDRPRGILSWWGPDEPEHGRMMVALKVDPEMIAEIREDADNYLVLLKVQPGQPFVYYSGSAWNLGQDHVNSREAWDKLVAAETVDFDPAH